MIFVSHSGRIFEARMIFVSRSSRHRLDFSRRLAARYFNFLQIFSWMIPEFTFFASSRPLYEPEGAFATDVLVHYEACMSSVMSLQRTLMPLSYSAHNYQL